MKYLKCLPRVLILTGAKNLMRQTLLRTKLNMNINGIKGFNKRAQYRAFRHTELQKFLFIFQISECKLGWQGRGACSQLRIQKQDKIDLYITYCLQKIISASPRNYSQHCQISLFITANIEDLMNTYYILDIVHEIVKKKKRHKHCLPGRQSLGRGKDVEVDKCHILY